MPGSSSRAPRQGAVTKEVIEFLDSCRPLELEVAWEVGIGGGLWTTGLLLCQHMRRHEAFYRQLLCGKRVLELGSGTGLVGLCVAQLGPAEVVLTDQADHLDLLTRNVRANLPPSSSPLSSSALSSSPAAAAGVSSAPTTDSHSPSPSTTTTPCHDAQLHGSSCSDVGPLSGVGVETAAVGVNGGCGGGGRGGADMGDRHGGDVCHGGSTKVAATPSAANNGSGGGGDNGAHGGGAVNVRVCEYDWNAEDAEDVGFLRPPFDVVVGTDVAYCPELYNPLVKALLKLCSPKTVIILGVTRTDTGRPFFEKLHAAGMDYCLIRTDDVEGAAGGSGAGENFVLLSVVLKKRVC